MFSDSCSKLGEVVVLPCRRRVLLARIRPIVAVVEIDHQPHAQCLSTLCLYYHVFLSAPSFFRVNPYPQADRVEADLLHQGGTFRFRAGGIVELHPVIFHLSHPADVRSFGIAAFDNLLRLVNLRSMICRTIGVLLACRRNGQCHQECRYP